MGDQMFNKKILCIGHERIETDILVSSLAEINGTTNNGLVSDVTEFIPESFGYYHTSIIDLSAGNIIDIAHYFDTIQLLDQPLSEWSHYKLLLTSYKLLLELEKLGHNTIYKDNHNVQNYTKFDQLLKTNKSFCIYPWINMIEEVGGCVACARSSKKITTIKEITSWKDDPAYNKIRTAMLKGEKLPEYCSVCYEYESNGVESYRTFETKEWLAKLDINSIEELDNITHPYYYEIRLSNKCNLMCRSCKPEHSHLIDREFKKFNIVHPDPQIFKYSSLDHLNIDTLNPKIRVYLTGGEPTIMPEVYGFMEQCIAAGKTDFEFTLGTNAQKLNKKFLDLAKHFTNLNFSVSLDGYGKINDYWRWGSKFDEIIRNTRLLESHGHNISINCVPGIYNVTNLHLLFEFLDREFPKCGMYLQLNRTPMQSVFNHPNAKLAVESMERCRQTNIYHTDGKSNKTAIDSLYDYYSNNPVCDLVKLKQFFDYNDKLDQVRNVKLIDYIPELEECRKYIK